MPRALSDSLVRPSLVRREQRHRRHVLIGLATLFVLSLSPLFGHHLIEATNWLPVTLEHLGPLCLVALHHLLAPVHGAFHVLLSIGVSYAVFERTRAAWRHARTMRVLPVAATVDPRLVRAAHAVGLDVARVHTVRGLPNPAFTSGWWTPQVYVSQSLPAQLSTDELEAVLAHELAHVRRRDPLRQFAWRASTSGAAQDLGAAGAPTGADGIAVAGERDGHARLHAAAGETIRDRRRAHVSRRAARLLVGTRRP